jgi:hypothetical protein
MVEAIDHRLHQVAEPQDLVLQAIKPLRWSSVNRLHCIGYEISAE